MQNSSLAHTIEYPNESHRYTSISKSASVLTDIYDDEINLAVWQRKISSEVSKDISNIIRDSVFLRVVIAASPKNIAEELTLSSPYLTDKKALCDHIELLSDMFCTLFDLKRVGLRLTTLEQAMCPKFHVDKVPCRLVTTLEGKGTQWLPNSAVDRSKLGAGSKGLCDETSGIMRSKLDVQQLALHDVALLKGEGWFDNENGAIVHRSPAISNGERRLLLTLDFMD